MAGGSASEFESHVLPSRDLKLIQTDDDETLERQITGIKRMLTASAQKLTAEG